MEIKIILVVGALLHGISGTLFSRQLGRRQVLWGALTTIFGPIGLLWLLLLKPLPGHPLLLRRWVPIVFLIGFPVVGLVSGLSIMMADNPPDPEKAVHVEGGRVVKEADGPTAYAVASLVTVLIGMFGAAIGLAIGITIAPLPLLAIIYLKRKRV